MMISLLALFSPKKKFYAFFEENFINLFLSHLYIYAVDPFIYEKGIGLRPGKKPDGNLTFLEFTGF